tara:strand:+ start:326 stop:682 length:357 start_codon:yes stop_codon:yes gene_type:complete
MSTVAKIRNTRKITPDEMRKMREKDHKMVKGIFRCYEPRGGSFTFNFKKYSGDKILKYTMEDGQTYDVPLMVAKHLNQNCWYPKHCHVMDANGMPTVDKNTKIKRCSFDSLEFMVEEE